jgi:hypothetical protein
MKSRQDFATEKEWLEYYRHYADAMAMQGLISLFQGHPDFVQLAHESVIAADALITALNSKP